MAVVLAIAGLALPVEMADRAFVYLTMLLLGTALIVALSLFLRHPPLVWLIIVLALGARVGLMLLLKVQSYDAGLDGFYLSDGGDAHFYHDWSVAAVASRDWIASLADKSLAYLYVVSAIYWLVGPDLAAAQLVNLLLGVLAVPLIYEIGRRVNGPNASSLGIILWAFLPSGVLWSVSILRDVWIVVGLLLVTLFLAGLAARPRLSDFILAIAGFGMVVWMRIVYFAVVIVPFAVLLVRRRGLLGYKLLFLVGGSGLLLFLVVSGIVLPERFSREVVRAVSGEGVEFLSDLALSAGSGIELVTRAPPQIRWLVQLPYAIFAPLPWQWASMGSALGRLAGIEMLVLYGAYFLIWRDRKRLLAGSAGAAVLVMIAMLFLSVSFALPNIGSIYRYRWPAVALVLSILPRWRGRRTLPYVPQKRAADGLHSTARQPTGPVPIST